MQFASWSVLWCPARGGVSHRIALDPGRWCVGRNGSKGLFALYAAPEARETDPVAECVDENDGVEGTRPDVDKGSEPAEKRRVGELEERAEKDGEKRSVGVGEGEFVEMVDVCDAEVERCDEGYCCGADFSEEVDGDEDGPEEDFFCGGTGNVVAVANP